MRNELIRIAILSLAVVLSFMIATINLHSYDVPIALILFMVLFITKKIMLPKSDLWKLTEAFILTLITLFTVLTTGAVHSPFFFLTYFLIFSLSLIFEPVVSFSVSMVIIFFFVTIAPANVPFKSLIPIFSLAFLSPFALLLSQERLQVEKMQIQDQSSKENTYLFLSLTLKKHLNSIKEILENSKDEKNAHEVKKQVKIVEKLIQRYEE